MRNLLPNGFISRLLRVRRFETLWILKSGLFCESHLLANKEEIFGSTSCHGVTFDSQSFNMDRVRIASVDGCRVVWRNVFLFCVTAVA